MGLPRSHIDFYTKYGIHLSSIATAACWRVVPAQGCRGCPCCVGSQSGNGTGWTAFVNSHNNNQTSLKILYVFFLFRLSLWAIWLLDGKLLTMTYLPRGLCDTSALFAWLISRTFSANEQYFPLTTNQPTVLSAMAYQPSEQGILHRIFGHMYGVLNID